MRKPYEYDVYKKERTAWLTGLGVFFSILLLIAGYFLLIYEPPVDQFVAPTLDENPAWVTEAFWLPLQPLMTNDKDNRTAIEYYNVLAQFQVETALRYKPQDNKTYCNIYAWDVASAMGVRLPHYLTKKLFPASKDAYYYTGSANVKACFLQERGIEYGWRVIQPKDAQERANEGFLTIGVWMNPNAPIDENGITAHYPSGHIMVVRPQPTGSIYRRNKGPFIAQAGTFNTLNANVSDVFGVVSRNQIIYYTHD